MSKTFIAIDPGACAGYAIFKDGKLVKCGLVDDTTADNVGLFDVVVYEHPFIYPRSKADPNDILTLTFRAGRLVQTLLSRDGVLHRYLPREWKGQIPKTKKLSDYIVFKRIADEFTPEEWGVWFKGIARTSESKAHNIVDAIGIGLHHLGRF